MVNAYSQILVDLRVKLSGKWSSVAIVTILYRPLYYSVRTSWATMVNAYSQILVDLRVKL